MKKVLVALVVLMMFVSPVSAGMLIPVSPSSIDIDTWYVPGTYPDVPNPQAIKVDYSGYARTTRLTCSVYEQEDGLPLFTFYSARLPAHPRVIAIVWFYDDPDSTYYIGCKATDGKVSDILWWGHHVCNAFC